MKINNEDSSSLFIFIVLVFIANYLGHIAHTLERMVK